jgi:hypothetical protein
MTLVPVSHDPFSNRPFSKEFNVLTANMAVTVNKLTELASKIEAVSAAAHRLDALLQAEIRKVVNVVDAGATHFDDKFARLSADIADVAASTKRLDDLGQGVGGSAKLAVEMKAAIKELRVELAGHVAAAPPVPVEIERSQDGRPMKLKKGDVTFSIERQDGQVVRIVPTGSETDKAPQKSRSSKRFVQ